MTWSRSDNIELKHVAVLAYGGLLGAWDEASAAQAHLFRMGFEDHRLRSEADQGLASLVAAGQDARRVRSSVLAMLDMYAKEQLVAPRVFDVLALVFRQLTRADRSARESLDSLQVEPENRSALARLVTLAFVTPVGFVRACACITHMGRAVSQGHVSEDLLLHLIRDMKTEATTGSDRARLGTQLKRSLIMIQRGSDLGAAEVASRVRSNFF